MKSPPAIAAVHELYAFYEKAQAALPATLPVEGIQRPIACAAGCSFCCHLEVAVTTAELAALVDWIASQSEDARKAIRSAVADAARRIGTRRGLARKKRRVMCPLLAADGRCGVYDMRPLSCRTHVSADREACRRDWAAPGAEVLVPQSAHRRDIGQKLHAEIQSWTAPLGAVPGLFELVRSLDFALREPDFVRRLLNGSLHLPPALLIRPPKGL